LINVQTVQEVLDIKKIGTKRFYMPGLHLLSCALRGQYRDLVYIQVCLEIKHITCFPGCAHFYAQGFRDGLGTLKNESEFLYSPHWDFQLLGFQGMGGIGTFV
jgi:hypothetical protein